jgi:hypothetical protein
VARDADVRDRIGFRTTAAWTIVELPA